MEPRFIDERILGVRRRYFYPLLLLLTVVVVAGLVLSSRPDPEAKSIGPLTEFEQSEPAAVPQIGQDAPAIDLPVLAGSGTTALGQEPVLVEFFASWCPHCQKMAPVIDRALEKVPVKLIMVGADQEPDRAVIDFHQSFLLEPLPGVVVNDQDGKVTDSYRIPGYPTFFFIDSDGQIASIIAGERSEQEVVDQLKQIKSR